MWGWAGDGEEITVKLLDQEVTVTAAAGKWKALLEVVPAGGPHEMIIRGENEITIKNILVGENWICGGQSNMAWPVESLTLAEAIAGADFPDSPVSGGDCRRGHASGRRKSPMGGMLARNGGEVFRCGLFLRPGPPRPPEDARGTAPVLSGRYQCLVVATQGGTGRDPGICRYPGRV